MGLLDSIRGFLTDLDNSGGMADAAKQQVETLAKLAEAKAEIFKQQIKTSLRTAGTDENATIPIESVLDTFSETYAYTSEDSDKIKDTIKDAITKLSPGSKQDIVGGIADTVAGVVGDFLGSNEGSDRTIEKTRVMTEQLSIIRVDFLVWKFAVHGAGLLKETARSASAFVLVKSSVDMSRLGLNTFLNLYQNQLKSVVDENSFDEAMAEANNVYRHFHEITTGKDDEGDD